MKHKKPQNQNSQILINVEVILPSAYSLCTPLAMLNAAMLFPIPFFCPQPWRDWLICLLRARFLKAIASAWRNTSYSQLLSITRGYLVFGDKNEQPNQVYSVDIRWIQLSTHILDGMEPLQFAIVSIVAYVYRKIWLLHLKWLNTRHYPIELTICAEYVGKIAFNGLIRAAELV
jgi:hypothetical protein